MADMSREVIAVDADEVSFPFLTEFTKYHNQQFGTSYRQMSLIVITFIRLWG